MKPLFNFNSRSKSELIGAILGSIGSFLGLYLFLKLKFDYYFHGLDKEIHFQGFVIFFIPACLALISSAEDKPYLMNLAFLLSFGIVDFISSFDSSYFVLSLIMFSLYFFSLFFMQLKVENK